MNIDFTHFSSPTLDIRQDMYGKYFMRKHSEKMENYLSGYITKELAVKMVLEALTPEKESGTQG